MAVTQKSKKKGKRPDRSPHRAAYWASGRLATRKIRRLMESGMSLEQAERAWKAARKRHYGGEPDLRRLAHLETRLEVQRRVRERRKA